MLEGLREGAMKEFSEKITRVAPNSKEFKILKNSKIGFSKRLFSIFNLELKRVNIFLLRFASGLISANCYSNRAFILKAKLLRKFPRPSQRWLMQGEFLTT